MRFALVAVLLASGCASAPHHRVMHYSWGDIVITSDADADCFQRGQKRDDGSYASVMDGVHGCVNKATRTIYLEDSWVGAEALPHELAHLDGHEDPARDGYNW